MVINFLSLICHSSFLSSCAADEDLNDVDASATQSSDVVVVVRMFSIHTKMIQVGSGVEDGILYMTFVFPIPSIFQQEVIKILLPIAFIVCKWRELEDACLMRFYILMLKLLKMYFRSYKFSASLKLRA